MSKMTIHRIVIAAVLGALAVSCSPGSEETTPKEKTGSQPPAETAGTMPTQVAGTNLTFSVESTVDPASVSGFVVGESATYKVVRLAGQTDAQGRQLYGIVDVPAGTHDIIITGRQQSTTASANDLGIRLDDVAVGTTKSELGQVTLPLMGTLKGTVVLAGTTNNLREGTLIAIEGADEHFFTQTITDGTFIVPRVPVGTHKVFVSRQGYHRRDIDGTQVLTATAKDLGNVMLFPQGGAHGQVKINSGAAVTGSLTVTVNIAASPDATVFMISADPNFVNQTYETIVQGTKSFTFPAAPDVNSSTLTLWAKFADNDNGLENTTSTTIRYDDALPPTPTFDSVSVSTSVAQMRVDFSEAVAGFTADDLVVRNGAGTVVAGVVSNFAADPAGGYTFRVTTVADFTVEVAAGAVVDLEGNAGVAGQSETVGVDITSPTPAITLSQNDSGSTALSSLTNESAWKVTVTFNEAVSGFASGDIDVSGGTLASFAAISSSVYTAVLTPTAESVTIDIDAGVAQDSQGNANVAGAQKAQAYSGLSALASVAIGCSADCDVNSVATSGDYVFAGLESGGVKVVSVGDKSSPTLASTISSSEAVDSVSVFGSSLAISANTDGIKIYGVSDPINPSLRDTASVGSAVSQHVVLGGYLYFLKGDAPRGIVPLSISDPDNIADSARVSAGTWPRIISASGSLIFAWGSLDSVLRSFSIATPGSPSEVASLALSSMTGLKGYGNTLHASFTDSPHYRVYDVSAPTAISLIGSSDVDAAAVAVTVQGDYSYVLSDSSVSVFSNFGGATPTLRGRVSATLGTSLTVSGEYIYVGTSSGQLKVIRHRFGSS